MKEIYFAALSLRDEDRAQYLSEHCPDDAMRREVQQLLAESTESATHVTLDSLVPPRETESQTAAAGLPDGALLGHYRIKQKLGGGGMGWVYEATDEKLRRAVAIKVLPPGRTDADMRRRLTREAQSASALNHPNIVTVYEVGRDGDTDFIAMECIQGRTLREIIGVTGLDARPVLRYAVQIADALSAAHEAQIVHRDLKPSNIMVTGRELVKVLDFGIAKQIVKIAAAGSDEVSVSRSGELIGSASYMSPEQAQGKSVDARSDIFSFGSVVYEMLTGRRAFQEETNADTLSAVVSKEPRRLRDALPALPRGLERVVDKCLQKNPIDRWQHMSDVKLILQDLATDLEFPTESGLASAARLPRRTWWAAAIGAVATAAISFGVFQYWNRPESVGPAVLRLVTADTGLNTSPALSHDGNLIAFASDRANEGSLDIWLQQVEGRDPIRVTSDPADETDPALSPDGSRIAFRSEKNGGAIYVIPALGGDPLLVARGGRAPRFSPDGSSIAYWAGREGSTLPEAAHIFIVDAGGGQPRRIDTGMSWARSPVWSPGGDAVAVVGMADLSQESADWWLLPINGVKPGRRMGASQSVGQSRGRPLPSPLDWIGNGGSRILFALDAGDSTNLWELPIDSSSTAAGPRRRLTVGPGRQTRAASVRTSVATRTVFLDETLNVDVWSLPINGDKATPTGEPRRATDRLSPDWSPSVSGDGQQLVYVSGRFGNWSIRSRHALENKERTHVTNAQRIVSAMISGDARRILFSNNQLDILSVPLSGGTAEKLCAACGTLTGVSADGSQFLYEPTSDEDLLLFDTASRKTFPLAPRPHSKALLSDGQLSGDGKWVAFTMTDSAAGTSQVFVIPVDKERPAPLAEWIPITESSELARDPAWSPSGNLIYFTSERDGFRCIWARRLHPLTRKPVGEAFPFHHLHSAAYTLRNVAPQTQLVGLGASASRLVFAVAGITGNIWLEDVPFVK